VSRERDPPARCSLWLAIYASATGVGRRGGDDNDGDDADDGGDPVAP